MQAGSTWLGRKGSEAFLIDKADSRSVFVKGLGKYPLVKFHKLFTQA